MGRVGAKNAEPCVTSSLPERTTQAPAETRQSVRGMDTFRAPASPGPIPSLYDSLTHATLLWGRDPVVGEKGSGAHDRCCRGDTCPLPSSSPSGPSPPPLLSASLQQLLCPPNCVRPQPPQRPEVQEAALRGPGFTQAVLPLQERLSGQGSSPASFPGVSRVEGPALGHKEAPRGPLGAVTWPPAGPGGE